MALYKFKYYYYYGVTGVRLVFQDYYQPVGVVHLCTVQSGVGQKPVGQKPARRGQKPATGNQKAAMMRDNFILV